MNEFEQVDSEVNWEGKIVRVLTYFSWDEALKGAGLEE